MNSRKGGKQKRSQALDLGFSDLLGQPNALPETQPTEPPSAETPAPLQPVPPVEAALPTINPPFAAFVESGDWRGLSEAAEARLGAEEKDPEARLLWIVAQLELKALPPFLLTPSFESVLEASKAVPNKELQALFLYTAEKLREALRTLGEHDLADSLPNLQLGAESPAADRQQPVAASPQPFLRMAKGVSPRQIALLFLAVMVCLTLSWLPLQEESEGVAVAALIEPAATAALLVPHPPRPQLPSQLSALMYEIENSSLKDLVVSPVSHSQVAPTEAVALSLHTPQEPAYIGELRRGERRPGSSDAHIGPPSRDVDSQARDLFGSKPESPRDSAPHLVQHFSKVRVYIVTSGAPVFSAASRQGAVLEELPAGAKVKVEGLEGEWLRLVSKSGRTGFIRRSDAEIFDPDTIRTRS